MTTVSRTLALRGIAAAGAVLATATAARSAGRLDELIRAAKGEKELTILASGETFGGQPAVTALNEAFNKRFNLDVRVSLTPGPAMTVVASRLAAEYKGNRPASTGVYMGPISMFVALDRDGVLERVDWTGIFPWVTRAMVLDPGGTGVLARTGPNAIMYNPKFLPPESAPKRYEDLVDPKLSAAWDKRLALPPYPDWLAALSISWGADRVREFAKKLTAASAGQLRFGDAQPLITGQYSIIADEGSSLELKWYWEAKGVTLNIVFGSNPAVCDYFQLGVPRNSPAPNLAKLFAAYMVTTEAQAITDKFGAQASHLVAGTRLNAYVREGRITLLDPRKAYAFYAAPGTPALYEEIGTIIRT